MKTLKHKTHYTNKEIELWHRYYSKAQGLDWHTARENAFWKKYEKLNRLS